jgi:hypothetical protein
MAAVSAAVCSGYELDYYGGGKTFLAAPFVDVHQI